MNKPNPNATEAPLQDPQEQRAELVARYLRGELSAVEAEAFETAYLDDPQLFEEVLLQQQLQTGLEEAQDAPHNTVKMGRDTQSTTLTANTTQSRSSQNRRNDHTPRISAWGHWAIAASMAFLALGLVVQSVRLQQATDELNEYLKPQLNIPTILIDSERSLGGESYTPMNDNPTNRPKYIYLKIDAPMLPLDLNYDVLIQSANTTYQSSAMIGDDGYLTVLYPLLQNHSDTHFSITVSQNNEPLLIKEISILL